MKFSEIIFLSKKFCFSRPMLIIDGIEILEDRKMFLYFYSLVLY